MSINDYTELLSTRLQGYAVSNKTKTSDTESTPVAARVDFAEYVRRKLLSPGGTSIGGKAGSGKTAKARSDALYLAEATIAGTIKSPCDLVMGARGDTFLKSHPAVALSAIAFSVVATQLGLIDEALTVEDANDERVREMANVAKSLRKSCAPVTHIRNEMGPAEHGVVFQLIDAAMTKGTMFYQVVAPTSSKEGKDLNGRLIQIDPLDLAMGLSFMGPLRIATVNEVFGRDIDYANTLSGGLDQALLYAVQSLSDRAALTGARIIMEMRDDHSSKYSPEANEYGLTPAEQRFMGVTTQAFYLQSLSRDAGTVQLVYRSRSITGQQREFQTQIAAYGGEQFPTPFDGESNALVISAKLAQFSTQNNVGVIMEQGMPEATQESAYELE